MLRGMVWRRLEGSDWYEAGGYFIRFHEDSETVWWAVPIERGAES